MLVEQTHEVRHEWRNNERPMRFTDTRLDEQQRAVSLKMVPMSLLLESSTGKSFLMNLIDTPGAPLSAYCRSRSASGISPQSVVRWRSAAMARNVTWAVCRQDLRLLLPSSASAPHPCQGAAVHARQGTSTSMTR